MQHGVTTLLRNKDNSLFQLPGDTLPPVVWMDKNASQPGGKIPPMMIVTWPQAGHAQGAIAVYHHQRQVVIAGFAAQGKTLAGAFQRTTALRSLLPEGPGGADVGKLRAFC